MIFIEGPHNHHFCEVIIDIDWSYRGHMTVAFAGLFMGHMTIALAGECSELIYDFVCHKFINYNTWHKHKRNVHDNNL